MSIQIDFDISREHERRAHMKLSTFDSRSLKMFLMSLATLLPEHDESTEKKVQATIEDTVNILRPSLLESERNAMERQYTSELATLRLENARLQSITENSEVKTQLAVMRSVKEYEKCLLKDLQCEQSEQFRSLATTFNERWDTFTERFYGKNSKAKGQLCENVYEDLLNKTFPLQEIVRTSYSSREMDFKVSFDNELVIFFEVKQYTSNVNKASVTKFMRDLRQNKCHGILISAESGIATKQNFEFEMINVPTDSGEVETRVAMYLTYHNYEASTLQLAVTLISRLAKVSSSRSTHSNTVVIDKKILDDLNKKLKKEIDEHEQATEYLQKSLAILQKSHLKRLLDVVK